MDLSEDAKHPKLSKGVLDMKFMTRTKERVLKEQEDAEGKAMYSNEITEDMRKSGNIIFTEASFFTCKNLIEGRLSFGGMNPELEKMMLNDTAKKIDEADRQKEMDVNDVDMARNYSSVVDTIGNKFSGRNKKWGKNRTFVKPVEDKLI